MRVLQVIDFYYPGMAHGGTAKAAYCISRELVRKGHEVTVITSDSYNRTSRIPSRFANVEGARVHYFKNFNSRIAWDHKVMFCPGEMLFWMKLNEHYDVVHLHNHYSLQNAAASYFATRRGIPYLVQAHGSLTSVNQKERRKKLFQLAFGSEILRNASKVIALTETEASNYQTRGVNRNKIAILPTGIDIAEFEVLPEKGDFRKEHGIDQGARVLLYIGRLHKSKGLEMLLASFIEISRNDPSAHLVLIGPDDGYKSEIVRTSDKIGISSRIHVLGFVNEDEKKAALVDSDVFVTPAYSGFPATFLEACACGTPLVTTTNGDQLN